MFLVNNLMVVEQNGIYVIYILKTGREGVNLLKYVMEVLRQKEAEEKIPVIRMEIDYELVTLHDAIKAEDTVEIIKTKERLRHLTHQLLTIQGGS